MADWISLKKKASTNEGDSGMPKNPFEVDSSNSKRLSESDKKDFFDKADDIFSEIVYQKDHFLNRKGGGAAAKAKKIVE
eukprot:CAMPEP_0114590832 /NCGR_PEP_ID=MMETSP0125-20121206/13008_1 /TAXON_ID=485358 ORGANISM="Aristerostoma sp., Strain ATCC 50986" /NCGR_SAMPLE_ID=MMETSP0125 /ASSEMBLY_ACC=CAM_ASM_000245 /LENGTH=78 /DNA_ID=CAMNT_0001788569 /DNA_START=505 /DNA_END=741 /DNA_ORIENTATION=-